MGIGIGTHQVYSQTKGLVSPLSCSLQPTILARQSFKFVIFRFHLFFCPCLNLIIRRGSLLLTLHKKMYKNLRSHDTRMQNKSLNFNPPALMTTTSRSTRCKISWPVQYFGGQLVPSRGRLWAFPCHMPFGIVACCAEVCRSPSILTSSWYSC